MNTKDKLTHIPVCAGIVTYNPDIDKLMMNFYAIKPQVDAVVIVDNGSSNIHELRNVFHSKEKVFLIENCKNEGIAKGLNQIFSWAKSHGFSWVLTLDQDTVCSDSFLNAYMPYINMDKIGIICPKVIYEGTELVQEANGEYSFIDACMTSGSLTSVTSWNVCDGFDEWMFIDLVDNDFCMRLKMNDYKILRINAAVMSHQVGNQETIELPFGKKIVIFNHSPFRNYYYVRNSIYYIRKYRTFSNIVRLIAVLLYWESKKIFFERNKIRTIYSMLQGLKDGLKVRLK